MKCISCGRLLYSECMPAPCAMRAGLDAHSVVHLPLSPEAERRWENGEEWHQDALAERERDSDDDVSAHEEAAQ